MSSYAKFKDEWVALYNQGMSMRAIGGQYGVSAGTEKKLSFNAEDNLYRLEFLNRSFIMSLVAAGIKPNERRGFQLPALVESLRVPFLVGYLEKRCYLDRARVHIQVPNGEALGLQAFL